jgi:simple sugar transport system ATP-binding protein
MAPSPALEITRLVLILDEPTSSLDAHETEQLFAVMRKLRQSGLAIVFITHFLDQVYEVADRITVLRNGRLVGTFQALELPRLDLIAKMLGRNLTELVDLAKVELGGGAQSAGEVRLVANGLGRIGSIEPFDLELRAGEVVGIAGLLGSGRTELAGLLFGIDKPDSGSITVNGSLVRHHSPVASIGRGVALCPEDRKAEGIVDDLTVRENIVLALQAGRGWLRSLSPTQQYEIALAAEGKSCVFISSEIDEVLRTSNRIVVLRDREKVTEFGGEIDEHRLMQAIAGDSA